MIFLNSQRERIRPLLSDVKKIRRIIIIEEGEKTGKAFSCLACLISKGCSLKKKSTFSLRRRARRNIFRFIPCIRTKVYVREMKREEAGNLERRRGEPTTQEDRAIVEDEKEVDVENYTEPREAEQRRAHQSSAFHSRGPSPTLVHREQWQER